MDSVITNLKTAPKAAVTIGFLGLTPFLSLTIFPVLQPHALQVFSLQALIAYSAVILSFLGGIRWGLAIAANNRSPRWGPLSLSISPAILGWIALLLSTSAGLLLLIFGFILMLFADIRLLAAPRWYRALRLPLSVGAIVCLMSALLW